MPEPNTHSELHVSTLGGFRLVRGREDLPAGAWGRDKALQLFQFLATVHPQTLHKEQITDRLWPRSDPETGDRDFRVALNTVNRVLEPNRPPRTDPRFVRRIGLAYGLVPDKVWIDAAVFERRITAGNRALEADPAAALAAYREAIALYRGDFLPERQYEDWTSATRERLQTLMLSTLVRTAELEIEGDPLESIRLAERALALDRVWEDAYRTLMRAYLRSGNRPLALRTYRRCEEVLREEFQIPPLPETQALYRQIREVGTDPTP